MKLITSIFTLIMALNTSAQDRVGYKFLELPTTVESAALGGFNHSFFTNNLSHSFHNPALLRDEMLDQIHFSFNSFYKDVKQGYLQTAFKGSKSNWILSPSLSYLNFGKVDQTDIYGTINGTANAQDWVLQVAAAKKYLEHWNYGFTLKYIHSQLAYFNSNALAADLALNYRDTLGGIQAAIVLKNIGTILNQFSPQENNILPFDVQVAFSYKFPKIPLQLSVNTMRFPLIDHYRNTQDLKTMDYVLRKFIISTEWKFGEVLSLNIGYHYAKRKDWSNGEKGQGILGMSGGLSFYHSKFQMFYGITPMQQHVWQQFGFSFSLKKKSIF